jgi:hypothetical protein
MWSFRFSPDRDESAAQARIAAQAMAAQAQAAIDAGKVQVCRLEGDRLTAGIKKHAAIMTAKAAGRGNRGGNAKASRSASRRKAARKGGPSC